LIPSVPEIDVLQRQLVLLLAQQRDGLLQVIALLAADAHAVAHDRGLHLELALLDRLDDLLRERGVEALAQRDALARALAGDLGLVDLQARDVDAAPGQLVL
jgi:hypothetical protein